MTNSLCSEKSPRWNRGIVAYVSVWVVAVVARIVYLWQIRQAPVFSLLLGDAVSYDAWASQIAHGDWFGKGVFYQAPLYPYFLGVLYALFGRNPVAVRLVQIIIGACSCVLLARAGRSFFKRSTGLLAGVVLAVYPTAVFFDCSIQKSVLDLFLVCGLLAALGRLWEHPQGRWWLGTGVILGLLALTRENALVFLPILLAWLFVVWRGELWVKRLRWAVLLLLGLTVVLLPVGCRNLLVGGEFHWTTAQFGPNFYVGNGREATGFYKSLQLGRGNARFERDDATRLAERAVGRKLTPSGVSDYWTARTMDEIGADIPRWLGLVGRKWLLVWNISEVGDSDDQYTYGDWSALLRTLSRLLHFGTLCPLAALGVCLTWKQRERVWLLYAMILGYAASVALFYVFSRYRYPLVPMLILFAAAGLTYLREALGEARWRAIGAGVATAGVAAAICNRAMADEALIRGVTHYNIAIGLVAHPAEPDQAIVHCMEAVRLMPESEIAHTELGALLARKGRTKDAIGEYLQALRLNPDYAEAHNNLGSALLGLGKVQEAVAHYEQALRVKPDYAEAHNNLGVAAVQLGRMQEAAAHWQQALRIRPDYAEAHYNWGVALAGLGSVTEAIGHYEEALRLKPDYAEAHNNLGNALREVGEASGAIVHFEQALRIKPDYAMAHFNLGLTLEQVGRMQEAMEHYEQALRVEPDFAEAQKRLARLRAFP